MTHNFLILDYSVSACITFRPTPYHHYPNTKTVNQADNLTNHPPTSIDDENIFLSPILTFRTGVKYSATFKAVPLTVFKTLCMF